MKRITVIDTNRNEYTYYKDDADAELFVETMKADGIYDSLEVAVKEMSKTQINAKRYLDSTDWYTCRKIDSDIAIPEEIIDARQTARLIL